MMDSFENHVHTILNTYYILYILYMKLIPVGVPCRGGAPHFRDLKLFGLLETVYKIQDPLDSVHSKMGAQP